MNKSEIIAAFAEQNGVTKKQAAAYVNSVFAIISKAVTEGNKVAIDGFGVFAIVERAARQGFNPQTKEKIDVPARKVVKFKATKTIKEAVAKL